MTNITPNVPGAYVGQLILAASSDDPISPFNAIGGNKSTDVFSALTGKVQAKSVDSIVRSGRITNQINNILGSAVIRIDAIREGRVTANAPWEESAAGFQAGGQPFTISLGDKGAIEVTAQAEESLKEYSLAEQTRLKGAFSRIDELLDTESLLQTRKQLRSTLNVAISRAKSIAGGIAGKIQFDFDVARQVAAGSPFRVDLDFNGEPIVNDQSLFHENSEGYDGYRIREAANQLKELQTTGSVTGLSSIPAYLYEGQRLANSKTPFFFALDPITGSLSAELLTYDKLEPSFLNESNDETSSPRSNWETDVLDFYRQGQAYKLEVRGTTISAKKLSYGEVTGLNQPEKQVQELRGAILGLFA